MEMESRTAGRIQLAHNLTNSEIEMLGIASDELVVLADMVPRYGKSVNVVRNKMSLIYRKLGAEGRWQAVMMAVRRGIIPPLHLFF
jgi:DNA-binding CsgD family transcriptional regulator